MLPIIFMYLWADIMPFHIIVLTLSCSDDQLTSLLKERHTKEDWVHLLQGLNQCQHAEAGPECSKALSYAVIGFHDIVLATLTPGKKHKQRFDVGSDDVITFSPGKLENQEKSSFNDNLIIPTIV